MIPQNLDASALDSTGNFEAINVSAPDRLHFNSGSVEEIVIGEGEIDITLSYLDYSKELRKHQLGLMPGGAG